MCAVSSFDPAEVLRAQRVLPDGSRTTDAATRLRALGHPARLALLLALDGRELCVCDCAQVLEASIPAASQHLKELRQLGAITFRTAGRMAYYRIRDPRWVALAQTALALHEPADARQETA